MLENAISTIMKKYAMTVQPKSWIEFIQSETTNIASRFRTADLWPLYFTVVQLWLILFKDGGIKLSKENPIWMRFSETVQTEVLSLPPYIDRQPQRRRKIDGNNWLLSREQLIQINPTYPTWSFFLSLLPANHRSSFSWTAL